MRLFGRPKKRYQARKETSKFLFLPIFYKGEFHWLHQVKLERAYNGYKMMIINLQKK